MLALGNVEVWRDGAPVVRNVSLRVDSPGLLWLVGPGGAGKSSLMMAMAGETLDGRVRMSGRCTWGGAELPSLDGRLAFLPQPSPMHADVQGELPLDATPAREAARARRADHQFRAVMDVLDRDAWVYLMDEPTAGLDEARAEAIRERLRERAAQSIVVAVTHNRQDCLATGGTTALLAGGTIHEMADSQSFFDQPSTEAGRVYVKTGNCGIPVTPVSTAPRNGIWWAVPGLLCGLPRPGMIGEAVDTYRQLSLAGVRRLLCLEERCEYAVEPLREFGISLHRFAIPDMAPPSFSQALDICRLAEPGIRSNEGIAAHCRGGLGRTGTVLASILIWFGDAAETAIERVRKAQPHAIQSAAQQRFLHDFADRIRGWR